MGGDEVPSNADRVDLDRLQQVFEGFSLTGSEARTLVALLRLGSAPLNQLCHTTGISRSNLYPVLDSLQARGLGHRLPGRYAVWTTSGAEAVLAVLEAADAARAEEARKAAQRRLEEARTRLAELPTPVEETPSVISLTDGGRLAVAYLEAMNWVDNEILVFNRGPYPGDIEPDEAVLGALARGVKARALWQSAELEDPDGVRRVADDYARAGVDQRVVELLPVSLAVLGKKLSLLSLRSEENSSSALLHSVVIRHQGMAQLVTAAFDRLWDQAQPYADLVFAGSDLPTVNTPRQKEGS